MKKTGLPQEAMVYYISHPVEFVQEMVYGVRRQDGIYQCLTRDEVKSNKLGYRLEWQTKEILNAIAEYDYVSVHSGKGVTKTFSLACAALWFLFTRANSKVIVTGPKYDQLKITTWAEISKWLQRSYLTDEIKWTSERMYHVQSPGTWFGRILTSAETENIQGIHADHVLWLLDEASNIEEAIIDTILGGMTDLECKIVMTGNPTKNTGAFYNSFTKDREQWKVLHFSSEDSERKNPIWFQKMQRHPRDSDYYRVNVLGFPGKTEKNRPGCCPFFGNYKNRSKLCQSI